MQRGRSKAAPVILAACLVTAFVVAGASAADAPAVTKASKEDAGMIENGNQVSIEYTLTLEDGTKVDTNVGGEPLVYEQGSGQIIPGLEEELAGLKEGDTKKVTVAPERGYGPVDPEAFQEVESTKIPEEARTVGTMLLARDASGNGRQVRVHEVKDETVVIDFNHPLAGKTLTFDVKILDINK